MAGPHTLAETERQVQERLGELTLDFEAMAVVSNLFRAANAVRNQLERSVLAPADLTWTAFVVLWVVWIWERIETRAIAAEGGFSKATLSGVLSTLESRGLLTRSRSEADGRLVDVALTPQGNRLMRSLFPRFNEEERALTRHVDDLAGAAGMLRAITRAAEQPHLTD